MTDWPQRWSGSAPPSCATVRTSRAEAQRPDEAQECLAGASAGLRRLGHRSRQETSLFDLASVVEGISFLHRNLRRWMQPERRRVGLSFVPASNRVFYQPLGVVGIISPWNYPVALAVMPLATALAAGQVSSVKVDVSRFSSKPTAFVASELLGTSPSGTMVAAIEKGIRGKPSNPAIITTLIISSPDFQRR